MNAEQNDNLTNLDGHVMHKPDLYNVVVMAGDALRHRSEPLPIEEASKRMAKLIAFQISAMGYKQVPYGNCVTLKRDKIELKIQVVKVA